MKRLILIPNKNLMCGMFQLAKELQRETCSCNYDCECHISHHFKRDMAKCKYCMVTDIKTKKDMYVTDYSNYDTFITLLYPMHKYGKIAKTYFGKRWICYDQGIPPVDRKHFPSFFRMLYMSYFEIMNDRSKQGADEYWDVTKREQKPRWTNRTELLKEKEDYAIYLGRTTDYKNYYWLEETMKALNITLMHPREQSDYIIHAALSNAKLLVTASLWEGYGRPVMEAEALGIPAVSYDTGAHKRNTKKGICVTLGNEKEFKKAVLEVWNRK